MHSPGAYCFGSVAIVSQWMCRVMSRGRLRSRTAGASYPKLRSVPTNVPPVWRRVTHCGRYTDFCDTTDCHHVPDRVRLKLDARGLSANSSTCQPYESSPASHPAGVVLTGHQIVYEIHGV